MGTLQEICVLAHIVAMVSCGPETRGPEGPVWSNLDAVPDDTLISLDRAPGFFECWRYEVQVDAGGMVTFEGSHSLDGGEQFSERAEVSEAELLDLLARAEDLRFLDIDLGSARTQQAYCGTDGGVTTTHIRASQLENTVENYDCEDPLHNDIGNADLCQRPGKRTHPGSGKGIHPLSSMSWVDFYSFSA